MIDQFESQRVLSLLDKEGIQSIPDIVCIIQNDIQKLKIDKVLYEVEQKISDRLRKYGKGAMLLGPFGYFHPSSVISIVTDNGKRGRLTREEKGCVYIYDFNDNNEITKIDMPSCKMTTLCEKKEHKQIFLTFDENDDRSYEVINLAFVEDDGDGLTKKMINVSFLEKSKVVGHIDVELLNAIETHKTECKVFTLYPVETPCHTFCCIKSEYEILYDYKGRITYCNPIEIQTKCQIEIS